MRMNQTMPVVFLRSCSSDKERRKMSVYTNLTQEDVDLILNDYALGELVSFEGIAAGIENSNFFVSTSNGRYVLTIFERMNGADLPYFMHLMHYLSAHDFPSPDVQIRSDGNMLFSFGGKQGCIVSCLPGKTLDVLQEKQMQAAGEALARLHLAGDGFPERRKNPTYLEWVVHAGTGMQADVAREYGTEAATLFAEELDWQQTHTNVDLPSGVIHADYFCDNILFCGNIITGVIDFYYACDGAYAYDLAIAANALAVDPESPGKEKLEALLAGYEKVRPLMDVEKQAFPKLLRLAALRFWVSRLYDALYPREGAMVQVKDPEEYRKKLLWCRSLS